MHGDTNQDTVTIDLTVNGNEHSIEVESRKLLIDALRDDLDYTGHNIGCETGMCGACTVHKDGKAIKSCTVLAAQCDGAEIRTIKNLGADGSLHPVQEAFHEEHGLQCGYCTPGMVMTALDILERNPNPDEDEVREGLEGNLCRCTGYQNIVQAIQTASDKLEAD